MQLGLQLSVAYPSTFVDLDAAAYSIAVARALGVNKLTTVQQNAINTFVKAEKDANRWYIHKRLFLHGWNNQAANAIDMITCASGVFVGSVIPSVGYVQSSAGTGYFNTGVSMNTLGLTDANFSLGVLVYNPSTITSSAFIGSAVSTNVYKINVANSTNLQYTYGNSISQLPAVAQANQMGVILESYSSGYSYLYQNGDTDAGLTGLLYQSAYAPSIVAANTSSVYVMAYNASGTATAFSNATIGASYLGNSISQANAAAFTDNLRILWESIWSLSLGTAA